MHDELEECLEQMLEAIKRLAKVEVMISMKKSIVGAKQGKILGHRWKSGGYFTTDDKKLKALLTLPNP